jgi:hypothetical protein
MVVVAAYAGAVDDASLARRFRRHGESLARLGRSPLYAELMCRAADDIEAGGPIAPLFEGVSIPPGSVPALRLLAALHELVLAHDATALAGYYPTAGGERGPSGVWPVARATIEDHASWIAERLHCTVQTNDVGRSAVLYLGLLWITVRTARPIRLLEIGASAGLNLLADRYAYASDGAVLGDAASIVRFEEPYQSAPGIDLRAAAERLRIAARAGCDAMPLNAADASDRLRLLSYIWPDELSRFTREDAAIRQAAADPPEVEKADAADWLAARLTDPAAPAGEVTVVWQSIFRQYVDDETWARLNDGFRAATSDVAWLAMEPTTDGTRRVELTLRSNPHMSPIRLAICGDHGPPITWEPMAGTE